MSKKRDSKKRLWVLKEELQSKKGKPVWFRFKTIIGPCSTSKPEERALFLSEKDAMNTEAYLSALCFFEPVQLEEGDEAGDLDWNRAPEGDAR